ncbi:unnamed protein product [Mesocestoides corti]|uniref:FACT complex subunit n=1 Tax=Mesocestoides corti TaxID=53468 RepID=A0A0R3UB93_MESCO|nr:unnamed protein product [Mesocestoides corti]
MLIHNDAVSRGKKFDQTSTSGEGESVFGKLFPCGFALRLDSHHPILFLTSSLDLHIVQLLFFEPAEDPAVTVQFYRLFKEVSGDDEVEKPAKITSQSTGDSRDHGFAVLPKVRESAASLRYSGPEFDEICDHIVEERTRGVYRGSGKGGFLTEEEADIYRANMAEQRRLARERLAEQERQRAEEERDGIKRGEVERQVATQAAR